jgi:hydrogenase maturation protease
VLERALAVRVIGLGSPFGDDRIGWQVVEQLVADALPAGADAVSCENPGRDLLPLLDGVPHVILVDALRGAGQPGEIVRCTQDDLAKAPSRWSSHGLGVADMLDLAASLGCLPARLEIIGIEVGSQGGAGRSPGLMMSPAVVQCGGALAATLRAEIASICHEIAERSAVALAAKNTCLEEYA